VTPLSATVSAPAERRGSLVALVPSLMESLLAIAAIATLLPVFARLGDVGAGRDQRFVEAGFKVQGLPEPTLPAVCAVHAALSEPVVRARLCSTRSTAAAQPVLRMPLVLSDALSRTRHAFLEPVRKAEARIDELKLQQREGLGEVRGLSDAIASIEAQTRPFVERFRVTQGDEPGPAPVNCAGRLVESTLAAGSAADDAGDIGRANAVLLLAAALDGHGASEALAHTALLPAANTQPAGACGAQGLPTALVTASALMADARQSLLNSRKNEAMRELLRSAGWQWAGAMLLGLVLLKWSRTRVRPAVGAAAALALWSIAAWVARVPWPFADRVFVPARLEAQPWSEPAGFVLVLAGAAVLLLFGSALHRDRAPSAPQAMSSRLGYPGLVLATGLGWLLLLDLSANGHAANRYLALYHQGHLWLGMLTLSVLLFLRQPLARALAWTLSLSGEIARLAKLKLGAWRTLATLALATLAAIAVLGLALSNLRQLTSELGRMWLIVGAAWFFFLRGGPLAERLSRSGGTVASVLRYVWPLLFVVSVLIAAMLVTRDMGPLLIAGYASGAFLGASVAMWWHQRTGSRLGAIALAVVLFAVWIAVVTMMLFKLGAIDSVTAARLESLSAPLASTNDQLALVSWFQRAAPQDGFGIGAVPWCGYSPVGHCGGVPAQIQSDYTFTAIVGAFGSAMAWLAAIGAAVWLHRLIRHHGRVTSGEPRFVHVGGRITHDGQAFLSWIAVAWVVLTMCQLAVTVAGNLAVLPLTGVTFPFVSFGMTSLMVNMAFLALCLNIDLLERDADE
jgi:cell division protein FtsW (lipid II flippase)